jgi:hypothetical protein
VFIYTITYSILSKKATQQLPITYNKAQAVNSNYRRGGSSFLQVKDLNYRDRCSFYTMLPTSFAL